METNTIKKVRSTKYEVRSTKYEVTETVWAPNTSYFVVRTSYFLLLTIPPYPLQLQQQLLRLPEVELMGVVGVVLFDGGERRCAFGEVFAVVEIRVQAHTVISINVSLFLHTNVSPMRKTMLLQRWLVYHQEVIPVHPDIKCFFN